MSNLILILGILATDAGTPAPIAVRVPCRAGREIDVGELVERLGKATGVSIARPTGALTVPIVGVGGQLSRTALGDILGPDARLTVEDQALLVTLAPAQLTAGRRPQWEERLKRLAAHVEREERRRSGFGMHARASYRPNDPGRPTVCLVHGLNSSSGGFVHMLPPIEEAGYGIVVYDYPYNRDLRESSAELIRDWAAFRRNVGETRPWALVAHSMGALLARAYVEDPKAYADDVSSLVLIAPVNQGSSLAKAQTFLQLLHGVQAVQGKKTTEALSHLGDGLGEAAEDMAPGSPFLTALNRRPRAPKVAYHIIAGDVGFLSREGRSQVQARINAIRRGGGLLGGLARMATADLEARLDEVSDGAGDGCVSVARTRLAGVADHVTLHANHAELIRAPLLFRDPGPVACMPDLLRGLKSPSTAPATLPYRPR